MPFICAHVPLKVYRSERKKYKKYDNILKIYSTTAI
jgi:hypothetical protein